MCLINCSFASATDCIMSPAVVSEWLTYNASYPAASALTDYVNDAKLSSNPLFYNFWLGLPGNDMRFVIDLGCNARVAEIHLRNGGTDAGGNAFPGFFGLVFHSSQSSQ